MTVLVVVAVAEERDAILRDLGSSAANVMVEVAGVGPVAAAVATASTLTARNDVSHVISAGIGGGFAGRAEVGHLVVASASMAADLGCRTDDGFLTLTDMGLDQPSRIEFPAAAHWCDRLAAHGLPATTGDIVTLSCMTGTENEAAQLGARFSAARAEAMEGWGVAWAARAHDTACGEIRAISNVIGKRDSSTWDIAGALDMLSRAFGVLLAEPLP